jgi:hypothetical protein
MPNARRAAISALLGEDNSYRYTDANVTGSARFGPIQYADIECEIRATEGQVVWYHAPDYVKTDYYPYISTRFNMNATLNNGTHFLSHTCAVRPASGSCVVNLEAGSGRIGDLHCDRSAFIDDVPSENNSIGAGFMAISGAFDAVFEGEASMSYAQQWLRENCTFAQLARFVNRTTIIMPSDLLFHMQRTLWHIPIASKLVAVPHDQRSGPFDVGGMITLRVADTTADLHLTVRFSSCLLWC